MAGTSLYVYSGAPGQDELLKGLGKFTKGSSCIYVKKLADIDLDVLRRLIESTIAHLQARYK
jgi:hypothetical protein